MIPIDAPFVHITAHIYFQGKVAGSVQGIVYSHERCPQVDVVTHVCDETHTETEVKDPRVGRYLKDADNVVAEALYAEVRNVFTQHRLEEAFRDWHEGRREAAREHAGELRRAG
jgi:hypothetical protein